MNRNTIIKKALVRLSTQKAEMDDLVKTLEKLYVKHKNTPYADADFSKDVVRLMQTYVGDARFEQKDKLYLFNELKKKDMFNWGKNKHLEKAWRFIFKKWDLPSLNFS